MNDAVKAKIGRGVGVGIGGLALIAYALTMSEGAFPGESARLIVWHTGLLPRLSPAHPLWDLVARGVAALPWGDLAGKLNWLSAICGALSVWLMYEIVARMVRNVVAPTSVNAGRVFGASILAGAAAALFLAFCIPFWTVSTRAHTASFDVFLLLALTRLFQRWTEDLYGRSLAPFAFCYGLCLAEFATLLVFLPVFVIAVMVILWQEPDPMGTRWMTRTVGAGVLGACFYFPAAWLFSGTEGSELQGFSGYFHVIWSLWKEQLILIARSLPREGWLIVLLVTVVPWLACLAVGRRGLNEEKDWTYYVLHAVLTAVVICVLLDISFSPWRMLGVSRLLVTPYVLAAAVFGYLTAYWYLLPGCWWPESPGQGMAWVKKWLGPLLVVPFLVLVAIAPFRNLSEADGRKAELVNLYAKEVVRSLSPGQQWLVTDGRTDEHLLIAARQQGRSLRLLNFGMGNNALYMRYVGRQFERPRLKNLAQVGLLPLLEEWMESDRDIPAKLAVQWPADLWIGTGYTPVPHRLVYYGASEPDGVEIEALMAEHDRFWSVWIPLAGKHRAAGALTWQDDAVIRSAGMVANNLGVFLEDRGRKDEAYRAYTAARALCPDNVSAILNLSTMVESGYRTEQADAIRRSVETLKSQGGKYEMWSLSRYYGYVRLPQAYAKLGLSWALSGQPSLAVSGLKKALSLLPDDNRGDVKQTLADLYLVQEQDGESEGLFFELLVENPANQRALLGMARISARKREFKKALEYLVKAEKAGVAKPLVALETASVQLMAGRVPEARVILEELVDLKMETVSVDKGSVWMALIGVLFQQNDQVAMKECIRRIGESKAVPDYILPLARGHLALMERNLDGAREAFESAIGLDPRSIRIMELLLRLDVLQLKKENAEKDIRRLLAADPKNAYANYVRGTLQAYEREYALAEDSFRRSLEKRKSPDVMNDLAWLLQKRKLYEEAERLVRAALEMSPEMAPAWDTLGVILMRTGRLDEAEKALEKTGSPSVPGNELTFLQHMAELQILKKNKARAAELMRVLSEKQNSMSAETYSDYKRIQQMMERL